MLLYLLITVAAFLIVHFSLSNIVEGYLADMRVAQERQNVRELAAEVAKPLSESDAQTLYRIALERGRSLGGRVLILNTAAVVQSDGHSRYNGARLPYPEVERVLYQDQQDAYGFYHIASPDMPPGESPAGFVLSLRPERQWVIYSISRVSLNNETLGAVLLSTSMENVMTSISELSLRSAVVFVIATISVMLLTLIISSFITKPIHTLTLAVRKMGRGQFHQRVAISGGSEIKELGSAFNLMSEKLERTDQMRNDFVSSASHELKTPLSTIKILIETILYQSVFDENMAREFLTDVNNEIDRLSQIISDLLRLVSIDQQQEGVLNKSIVHVDTLIFDVAKRLLPQANKRNIDLITDSPPIAMIADSLKLQQALFNLIDNAIKYTEPGGSVTVQVSLEEDLVLIAVKDTGYGIPKEDLPRLFERFYRVDKARSRGTGGTGLGLSIVERIAQLHGGWVLVESVEGEGSTFTLVLPSANEESE